MTRAYSTTDWQRDFAAGFAAAVPLEPLAPLESVSGSWESIDAHLTKHELLRDKLREEYDAEMDDVLRESREERKELDSISRREE